jgi:hypothetical protein
LIAAEPLKVLVERETNILENVATVFPVRTKCACHGVDQTLILREKLCPSGLFSSKARLNQVSV